MAATVRHTWMLEPPNDRIPSDSYRAGCGDIRVTTSVQGQPASDKASAARFNDCKGVDSSASLRYSLFPAAMPSGLEAIRGFNSRARNQQGNVLIRAVSKN